MRLFAGLVLAWLIFDRSAAWLGSTHGQAGIAVAALVIAVLVLVERWLFRSSTREALSQLGLGRPARRGLVVALAITALMLVFFPAFAWLTGNRLTLHESWVWLLPGLFAQGGIAEEALFRGYLFGHLRRSHGFWRAAWISVPGFLAVHLLLLATMPLPIAASALLMSVVISFPFARLFELCGSTVWAPALIHFVIQAGAKLVLAPEPQQMTLVLSWMGVSMTMPWLAFLVPTESISANARPGTEHQR